ncbi:hypothetical protein [Erythrobacter sp.]|uniref:hypothetical protein n=1 Tax=Erythrobacter sp. TaxID=1042 RepID=UPI0025F91646|nr:hypothetical protein [Erythrobacter sp.]
MKWRKGPRPWPIHLFAAIFLMAGAWELAYRLAVLHRFQMQLAGQTLSEDWIIVFFSARFTIVCIPVIAIWLFGSRVARWLITIMTVWATLTVLSQFDMARLQRTIGMNPLDIWYRYGARLAYIFAVALLFIPAARRWFARQQETVEEIFE